MVFKDSVSNPAAEAANLMRGRGGQLHHTYSSALKGFAASLPDAALQGIRNNPNVDYIEQDQTVSLNETQLPVTQTQFNATWGLDRIDQTDRPLDTQYHYNYTDAGVNAFIIDTGIRATHTDFQGRVQSGYTAINDGNDTTDCNGHGTHVAGTVGGLTWGVAKGVALIPVRVLDCSGSGTWAGVISGIDWVVAHKKENTTVPAVANMSLGGGASQSVDTAVANAVNNGVTVVVAAGNSSADACKSSPARAPSAITVGATTSSDKRAFYSNYGKCLDLFAPGSGITSASISSNDASTIKSGTSMASPHVAGVAALALAAKPAALPGDVASFLTTNATPNKLGSDRTRLAQPARLFPGNVDINVRGGLVHDR
ncbi:S8 family peptidase [Polaromonas sp. P1-6]|nr:S8 family peptidase [Polaromonas sp. P1-6]